jgi:hypothetical protein
VWEKVKTQKARLDSYQVKSLLSMEDLVRLNKEDFYKCLEAKCLEAFKTVFTGASRGLGGRLDDVILSILGFSAKATGTTAPANCCLGQAYQPVEQTVNCLSRNVAPLPS